MAGHGNQRNFGALKFRRLLKTYILGGGHKIPLRPKTAVKEADAGEAEDTTFATALAEQLSKSRSGTPFDEPVLSYEVTDELWNEDEVKNFSDPTRPPCYQN